MGAGDRTTLEWFGTTTFRVRHAGVDLYFDAYLDRLPGLAPVGLSTAEVSSADFVFVSHAHFDHLYGADTIALRTGATVVASPESAACLRANGVPEEQVLVVTGGETVQCGPDARVRVLPALHSCLFAQGNSDSAIPCLGDLDVSAQERRAKVDALFDMIRSLPEPLGPSLAEMMRHTSPRDGGQLSYLLMTSRGSLLVSGSAGYWRGIYSGLRPDVALLAVGGRPNVDGEPYQGSTAQFVLEQVESLQPGKVALCHHDPLVPGLPGVDTGGAVSLLRKQASRCGQFGLEYATPIELFG